VECDGCCVVGSDRLDVQPIATENFDVFSASTLNLLVKLGLHPLCDDPADMRQGYFHYSVSTAIQRFNSVLFTIVLSTRTNCHLLLIEALGHIPLGLIFKIINQIKGGFNW